MTRATPSTAYRSNAVSNPSRSWIPLSARPATPAAAASRNPARNVWPFALAYASTRATAVPPAHDSRGPPLLGSGWQVVGDEGVRGIEDCRGRPVVLVEDHDRRLGEDLFEAADVAVVGASEPIDRLILIADRHQIAMLFGQQ